MTQTRETKYNSTQGTQGDRTLAAVAGGDPVLGELLVLQIVLGILPIKPQLVRWLHNLPPRHP